MDFMTPENSMLSAEDTINLINSYLLKTEKEYAVTRINAIKRYLERYEAYCARIPDIGYHRRVAAAAADIGISDPLWRKNEKWHRDLADKLGDSNIVPNSGVVIGKANFTTKDDTPVDIEPPGGEYPQWGEEPPF